MTRLAWCTDLHLDFLSDKPAELESFARSLVADSPDAIMITGDIAISNNVVYNLSVLERICARPIYFVLGNHDFYNGSFESVRKSMHELNALSGHLKYLPLTSYVSLSPTTAIVGHDGWYDALNGDFKSSNYVMSDWVRIHDFVNVGAVPRGGGSPNYGAIVGLARKAAHEATTHVMKGIKAALRYHKVIVVATHVPPFAESHVYNGRPGEANAQPWYTSQMMGSMLRQAAAANPNVRFEVFSGHTHGKCDVQISSNLYCHVGDAEYYHPASQGIIQLP